MIEQLTDLGLPSGFVGMVLIAVIFRKIHQRVALVAAIMAVLLVGIYGTIQLIEAWSGEDIQVAVSPVGALAFDRTGPISLDIVVSRGDTRLATTSVAQPSADLFDNNLRNIGWKPAAECLEPARIPSLWSTNRVYAGQTQRVGQTDFGLLFIDAQQFTATGEAVVALELRGSVAPIPEQLAIRNKGIGVPSCAKTRPF